MLRRQFVTEPVLNLFVEGEESEAMAADSRPFNLVGRRWEFTNDKEPFTLFDFDALFLQRGDDILRARNLGCGALFALRHVGLRKIYDDLPISPCAAVGGSDVRES